MDWFLLADDLDARRLAEARRTGDFAPFIQVLENFAGKLAFFHLSNSCLQLLTREYAFRSSIHLVFISNSNA